MPAVIQAPVETLRRTYEGGWFELALRPPDPRLAGQVAGSYCGWVESSPLLSRRKELPSGIVPVIFNLGPAIGVETPRAAPGPARYFKAFAAGLHDSFAITESRGELSGVQVNFTPLGARRFLGLPMHELANRVVELEDLFGPLASRLLDRLREAGDWEQRFALLDRFIAARLDAAPVRGTHAASAAVLWGWQRLHETGGRLAIGDLAREVGCSHKHLIALFREQIGLPPKTVARVLRFHRAVRLAERAATGRPLVEHPGPGGWAEIAYDCGYADQAHLIREFGELAGSTPGDLLRDRLAAGTSGVEAQVRDLDR